MKRSQKRRQHTIARIGLLLALVSALVGVASGPGTRFELWDFRTGLVIFRWAAYLAAPAALLSLAGLVLSALSRGSRGFLAAVFGLIISAIMLAVPLHMLQKVRSVPAIHDITTDTENPPEFLGILPLRGNAPNPSQYGGEQIAVQQHRAYPDIEPLILNIPPEQAFDKALQVARNMGWKIVDADKSVGRIEATDTTFWFGFKDDIVIRVEKKDAGSRVDIRSVSRVGKSDVGTNAERIRKFLREMGSH